MTDSTTTAATLMAFDPQQSFLNHFNAEVELRLAESGYPLEEWQTAGRKTKALPNGQDRAHWEKAGPELVKAWMEWRSGSDWVIWEPFPQIPFIELEMNVVIGPYMVVNIPDRVFVTPDGELVLVDLKTGSRTPDSDLQLGFQASAIELTFGTRPKWGAYWMAAKATMMPPIDLDKFSVDVLADELTQFKRAIDNRIFIPHRGSNCKRCGVAEFCPAVGGARAHEITSPPAAPQGEG